MPEKSCLIIVDVQNDFCEGGALAVPGADEQFVKDLGFFAQTFDHVVLTQDWHPADHSSFKENGGPWPVHCVAGSDGAQLAAPLVQALVDAGIESTLVRKGEGDGDGYSAARALVVHSTYSLADWLHVHGFTNVHVVGLALDYCVRETAIDLAKAGISVIVHTDGTREVAHRTGAEAKRDLLMAGIITTSVDMNEMHRRHDDERELYDRLGS